MTVPHSEKNGLLRDWQRRVADALNSHLALFDKGTYSPTLSNGGAGTTEFAHWSKNGNVVRVAYARAFTGAGSAAGLNLPVPINFGGNTGAFEEVGSGYWYDLSGVGHKGISVRRAGSGQTVEFLPHGTGVGMVGTDLANGDAIRVVFTYEWA